MKKALAAIGLIYTMLGLVAFGQSCTTTSPCYQVTVGNGNSLPASVQLWRCVGGSATCSQSALASAITQQQTNGCSAVNSTWSCITFSQTKPNQAYNDPVQYGALMNYAASGGGAAGPSSILTFPVPQAPQALVLTGGTSLTTSGNSGVQ